MGTGRITSHAKTWGHRFVLSPSNTHSSKEGGRGVDGGKSWIFLGVPALPTHTQLLQHVVIASVILQIDIVYAALRAWAKRRNLGWDRESPRSLHSRIWKWKAKLIDNWRVSKIAARMGVWIKNIVICCVSLCLLRSRCQNKIRHARNLLGKTPVRMKEKKQDKARRAFRFVM